LRHRLSAGLATVLAGVVLGACGGGSSAPKVGDCIDASNNVVSCSAAGAKQQLVSDQDAPNAIACVEIGDKPQVRVTVAGHHFCAQAK